MRTFTKRFTLPLLAVLLLSFTTTACNNTGRGAGIGAGIGAVFGAAIGKSQGETAKGAIIGAAVGGAAGAIIGRQMDKQAEELEDDLGDDVAVTPIKDEETGETAGIAVTFDSAILFDVDSATLKSASKQDLMGLAESLKKYDNTDVVVVGHTDATGSDSYNQQLSERRANAAKSELVAAGVAPARITAVGKGEMEPIADNGSVDGRRLNRRVEVAIFPNEEFRQEAEQQADGNGN